MTGHAHRIGRLRFDLTAPGEDVLGRFSAALEQGGAERVSAALEAVLTDLVPDGTVLHLDRLELDLGDLAEDGTGLDAALARALAMALPQLQAKADRIDPVAVLCGFLETGQLPQSVAGAGLDALVAQVLADGVVGADPARARLQAVLLAPLARQRAVAQLPAELLAGVHVNPPTPEDARTLARHVAALQQQDPDALIALIDRWAKGEGITSAAPGSGGEDESGSGPAPPVADPDTPRPFNGASTADAGSADPGVLSFPVKEAALPQDLSLHIPAAGLVLISPFLAPYFDALGLSKSGAFRDPEAQLRAVLLTQALATGQEEAPEPDLVLAKLLCGVALQHPVPRSITRTDAERDEAETLLGAVIQHWGALGGTSAQGLQEAFLQRPGVLQITEQGRFLIVERRGTDVLLDRLPWTLSLQQTPFMEAPLLVDWR